jgi:glycosyltransferase involved in cell wall biosynthesis
LDLRHKGLDLVVGAVARIAEELRAVGFRLQMFGPESKRGGRGVLLRMIAGAGVEDLIQAPGPVRGERKSAALRDSDLFLMASRFEGMPIAVLEALSHGLPVLVTPGTNMAQDVLEAGAGWVADPSEESIARGLLAAVTRKERLSEAGARGRRMVESRFSWEGAAEEALSGYREVLERNRSGRFPGEVARQDG